MSSLFVCFVLPLSFGFLFRCCVFCQFLNARYVLAYHVLRCNNITSRYVVTYHIITQLTVMQLDRRRPAADWLPVLHGSVQPGIPHQTALLVAARAEDSPGAVHDRPSAHLVARRQRHDRRVEPARPSQRRALHTERHHRHHGNQVSAAR